LTRLAAPAREWVDIREIAIMGQVIRKVELLLAIIALALPFLAAGPARAQATRTWVSGTGNDDHNCSRTAPCKTFQGALNNNKTAPGGEINCLDPGDFGPVTITFSLTISCEAGTAGIQASSDSAIFINAATTDVVTLRGLDINGQGGIAFGIGVHSAGQVNIEKCAIRNFVAPGIDISTLSTLFLFVTDTVVSDNGTGAQLFNSNGSGYKVASLKNVVITGSTFDALSLFGPNVYVNVTESIFAGNGGNAVGVFTGGTVNVERSMLANNAAGLNAEGGGSIIRASGNNIYNNTSGILIVNGGTIQSDGTNKHGNSNGGAQVPNASLAEY